MFLSPQKLLWHLVLLGTLYTHAGDEFSPGFIQKELERAKTDPDHTTNIMVRGSIDEVFTFLLERLDLFISDARRVAFDHNNAEVPGALGVGSERRTTMANQRTLVQRMLHVASPTAFAYFTDMEQSTLEVPITYSVTYYQLTKQENGAVDVRVSVVFKPKSRVIGPLVRLGFKRGMNRDFKKAAAYLNAKPREETTTSPR